MRTITFYSYKGGVGRSLLVANAARYLSGLGKSVFALDLDLEAPGLHYKFELGRSPTGNKPQVGVLNILSTFVNEGTFPTDLSEFAQEMLGESGDATIHLMRAGTAPDRDYWRLLSKINWHELFYSPEPKGVLFFLELKERIRCEFKPDFLLIDARTGITDMGGIATTVLPDTVVCLALESAEHLEGVRAVLQGIRSTPFGKSKFADGNIVPVLSRLQNRSDSALEKRALEVVHDYLNNPNGKVESDLGLGGVLVLHSEPLLDAEEQLLVGGKKSPSDLPLLRDYLSLFSRIIPADDIRPHVGKLIQRAISRLLDDPKGAQSDLETLTASCADQEAYRALIKFYRATKAPLEKLVAAAALMWQLCPPKTDIDPLLEEVVSEVFGEQRATDIQSKYAEFAEAVWRSSGMKDFRVGLSIVNAYLPERRKRARDLLSDYVYNVSEPNSIAITKLIGLTARFDPEQAYQVVDRFKSSDSSSEFQAAWARLVIQQSSSAAAAHIFADPLFRPDAVRAAEPLTLYRLQRAAGLDSANALLMQLIEDAARKEDPIQLRELAEVMHEEGRVEQLSARLDGRIPDRLHQRVFDEVRRSSRSRMLLPGNKRL